MKKVIFFHTAHPRLNLIGQIQLEIIAEHLSISDEVYIVPSNFELVASQTNYVDPKYSFYHYNRLLEKTVKFLESIGNPLFVNYTNSKVREFVDLEDITTLRSICYKGVNIGIGVLSSVISLIRDHEFSIQDYRKEVIQELFNAALVIDTLEELCLKIKPDLVYVFNGRMSTYSPVVRFCQKHNIDFKVFEFTSRYDKYHVLNCAIPHDTYYRENEMRKAWSDNVDLNFKKQVSDNFFEAQMKGITLMDGTFANANISKVQVQFEKEVITFFNSSIDEFASVPGWEKYVFIYENEVDAILDICNFFEKDDTKQFVLRIHPNLRFLDNTQTRHLLKLQGIKNLKIYESTSDVSSYELLRSSNKIITFGSTLGIEACFFGKPSILLGKSFFENLDVSYLPRDRKGLMELINDDSLKSKPKENVMIYGYWWMSFGNNFAFRDNKIYLPNDLDPTFFETLFGVSIKLSSPKFWKRVFKIFDINNVKKMKNSTYRTAILRELMPWIKK
ncbi:capsular polysaccharide export protein, LipB/KpsS family [Sphingobacterium sp. MYb382]|uniref:capsular polysaccharide export protein, LipB/KpsS family n=1 Tax=Sphingobacterium sp. MYb382 TaxID=2745278 RepID=UPI0030A3ED00